MNFLIASDKFKGSLTSVQVNRILRDAVQTRFPQAAITLLPASDGGDGFLDAIAVSQPELNRVSVTTEDPLGREMISGYLLDRNRGIAYIESAKQSGLVQLKPDEQNPEQTSTRGTGRVIAAAIETGVNTIYVGLGGSSTNDGGIGIAAALSYRFLDADGNELPPCGQSLTKLNSIEQPESLRSQRFPADVVAVNDVRNPLHGPRGAAVIYGPQKGADEEMIQRLDGGLRQLAAVAERDLNVDPSIANLEGVGAAGGMGYGLSVFCQAKFVSGAELILSRTDVPNQLSRHEFDWVLTGEGKLDDQTAEGKWVGQLASLARQSDTQVSVFCGQSSLSQKPAALLGIDSLVCLTDRENGTIESSMSNAAEVLRRAADDWARELSSTQRPNQRSQS